VAGSGFGGSGGVGDGADAGVVAAAGADGEFGEAFGLGFYVDLAVAAEGGRLGGVVGDGVLGADVVGDFFSDGVDFLDGFGEVGLATGLFGEGFEDAAGVAGLTLIGVVAEEEADGVDDGAVEVLIACSRVAEEALSSPSVTMRRTCLGCLAFLER